MQDARDERGRGVQEAQVCFQVVIVRCWGRDGRPQDGVVVGEEGEDDAQEEAGCWLGGLGVRLLRSRGLFACWGPGKVWGCDRGDLRQTMRKVANDPLLKAIAKGRKADFGGCEGIGRGGIRGEAEVLYR